MSNSQKSQTPVHVQYRNGTYYGQISSDYKRNGKGMLILDTSTVMFGDWRDNQIQGMYVYINDGIRAYGNMINGKLDGYNIISTTASYSGNGQSGQYSIYGQPGSNKVRTFYGTFRNDKIYGRCVLIDNDSILISQFNNNELEQILSKKSLRERQLYEVLKEIFPNNIYTLDEYLTAFIKNYISQIEQLQQISRYEPCINYFSNQSDEKFYGFQQVGKPNKKFGILMLDNELISVGEHNNNILQGIGRLYVQDHIYDGAFRNGQIDGIGIDFQKTTNKFILQVHDGIQDRVEKGLGFPQRQILQFRKQFHLRSIYFYNDIAILGLKNRFEGLIGHIFISPKRPTIQQRDPRDFKDSEKDRKFAGSSRSGSKRIQNASPLRQRLSKYQMESDIIEDNSPIRNRPNEYRPIDKTSSYFRQDNKSRDNERFSRTGQLSGQGYNDGVNSRGRYMETGQNHSSNKSQDRNQRFSQDKSRNKFQQRETKQRETYNQILRQNPSYLQPSQSRPYSNKNPGISRQEQQYEQNNNRSNNRKHTRDLVKQLQNQEKQRRLTLDEIYSKSNLYGRAKR